MKKIICFFMSASLLFSICVMPISAVGTNSMDEFVATRIPDLVTQLSECPERYGLTNASLDNAYVSRSFAAQNGADNVYYYAIVSGETVLGVISVIEQDETYSMSYAKDFADTLTLGLKSENDFSLVWGDDGMTMQLETYQARGIQLFNTNGVKSALETELCEVVGTATYALYNSSARGELDGDFPLIYQHEGATAYGGLGWSCVVTCAKAMAQYFEPSLSAITVAETISDVYNLSIIGTLTEFNSYERAHEIFDAYVDNAYAHFTTPLSLSIFKDNISGNHPVLCIAYSESGYHYHGTVAVKYSYGAASASYMINMMDPSDPAWRIVFGNGTDDMTYTLGTQTLT